MGYKEPEPAIKLSDLNAIIPAYYAEADRKDFSTDTINGLADHIHILLCLNPKFSISSVVKHLKGESFRWLNESELTEEYFQRQDGIQRIFGK